MTIKKLSDIGHRIFLDTRPHSMRIHVRSEFTPEEVRELVRLAYEAGAEDKEFEFSCVSYRTYERGEPNCSADEFLKDEGL